MCVCEWLKGAEALNSTNSRGEGKTTPLGAHSPPPLPSPHANLIEYLSTSFLYKSTHVLVPVYLHF